MRILRAVSFVSLVGCAAVVLAQAPAKSPSPAASAPAGAPFSSPPPTVEAQVVTIEVEAALPGFDPGQKATPDAIALLGHFRSQAKLVSRIWLAQNLARQEIVSQDFVFPAGTVILHKGGDRLYAVLDTKAKTYAVLDADTLLSAMEGGVGIQGSKYDGRVRHTGERKTIGGFDCRKSVLTVSYGATVPLESGQVYVQQKNEVEVWHTAAVESLAALDHIFLAYQRDRSGALQRMIGTELGFPMETTASVSVVSPGTKVSKAPPGTIRTVVTEARKEPKVDPELFRIPPAGYRKVERLPFKAAP